MLPLNDNTAPPFRAVYRWGQGGCISGKYDAYGPWLNRTSVWAEDFMPVNDWSQVEGQEWILGTWAWWLKNGPQQPQRRLILTPPMLTGGWDDKGPDTGPGAHVPVSLAEGAKGTYNIYYQHLAENLVKHGLADKTILRPGHEFNGTWYSWRVSNAKQAEDYAAYYRQIVTTMKSVPGAENLKFVWNPALMPWWPYDPEKAWPGDDVVDYVGLDVYDQSWLPNTYPIPAGASDEEATARRKRVWDEETNSEKNGLPYWVKFAARHGNKPLCLPEWGACIRDDKHGGGDSAYFIDQMYKFIYTPSNNVYFECYFDVSAGDGDHRLIPEPNKKDQPPSPTQLPNAAAEYQKLFSLPGGKTASTPTTSTSPDLSKVTTQSP